MLLSGADRKERAYANHILKSIYANILRQTIQEQRKPSNRSTYVSI